ncbi:MAG: kelch repeat-containing protein [Myxococcales bacterium]|nr:kelch repeat-containing protein [Myxococcales bacterium]
MDRARADAGGSERGGAATGVIDGKIYVAGGLRNGAGTTDVSIYDPLASTWTPAPPLPVALDHACGASVGGKLYVVGGRAVNPGAPVATVYELTPGGGWIERAPMPTARGGAGCGVSDDRIVVAGGEGNPAAGSRGVFPQVEAYTPSQDTWETLAPMPTPRHGLAAAAWDGRLYVAGGATVQGFGAVATHEILTP